MQIKRHLASIIEKIYILKKKILQTRIYLYLISLFQWNFNFNRTQLNVNPSTAALRGELTAMKHHSGVHITNISK